MASIINCKDCGKPRPDNVPSCPYCKKTVKSAETGGYGSFITWLIIGVIVLAFLGKYAFDKSVTSPSVSSIPTKSTSSEPKHEASPKQTETPQLSASNNQPPQQQNTGGSSWSKMELRKSIDVCKTLDDLSQLARIAKSGDTAAYNNFIDGYGNRCGAFSVGRTVFIENVSSNGIATLRLEGTTTSVYTFHAFLQDKYQLGQ